MPAGRPTKYEKSYCDLALELIGDNGYSLAEFAKHIRADRATVHRWAEKYPEFRNALTRAKEWSQAYWEGQLKGMMLSRDVNAPLVKLYFANRFNWTDKATQEEDQSGQPLSITFNVRDAKDAIEITRNDKS